MTEAKFQTAFTKWAKHNVHTSTAFELKVVKGHRLAFSAIREHQWICLKNAKNRNLVYKIPDVGLAPKPFDCFVLAKSHAYFAILFYEKRGEKEFYLVDVEDLSRAFSSSRSISREEVSSISAVVGRFP